MLSEVWADVHEGSEPLIEAEPLRLVAGVVAGLGIGMVAALLGLAGGELLIPIIVLLCRHHLLRSTRKKVANTESRKVINFIV